MTIAEFRGWCAFYIWEAEAAAGKKVTRPRNPREAMAAIQHLFTGRSKPT